MSEDDKILEYRPISRKRMKIIHVEKYNEIITVLMELLAQKYYHWDEYKTCWCNYCESHWKKDETHKDNCPIKHGQDLLRSL